MCVLIFIRVISRDAKPLRAAFFVYLPYCIYLNLLYLSICSITDFDCSHTNMSFAEFLVSLSIITIVMLLLFKNHYF